MQHITKCFETLNALQFFWNCNPGQNFAESRGIVQLVLDADLSMHIHVELKSYAYTKQT